METLLSLFGCCGGRRKDAKKPTETSPLLEDDSHASGSVIDVSHEVSSQMDKSMVEELEAAQYRHIQQQAEARLASRGQTSPSMRSLSVRSHGTPATSLAGQSPRPPLEELRLLSDEPQVDEELRSGLRGVNGLASPPPRPDSSYTPSPAPSPDKASKKKKKKGVKLADPDVW